MLDNDKNKGYFEKEDFESDSFGNEAISFIRETLKIVVISLAIILPIRYYLVQPFFVKGASMESSFKDGDYLLIDEISYIFSNPERGDVVVFRFPEDKSQFFIKRIIGLPRETIKIEDGNVVVINKNNPEGFKLEETYLDSSQITLGDSVTELEENEYFVLGDNRLHSADSRRWGGVDKSLITGKVFLRAWPFNKFDKIELPTY